MPKIRPDQLNASIRDIPIPDNLRERPVSKKGYPVPYFAALVDGEWDFRVVYPEITRQCIKRKLCWICGQQLGSKMTFVAGPMCVVTRTSAEPPSHQSCAEYAAIACPFLANPAMRRNDKDLPGGHVPPAGHMIARNPGVSAVLTTNAYRLFRDERGGVLIQMGRPTEVKWFAQRRLATQAEVVESIETGLPALLDQCNKENTAESRREAHAMLASQLAEAIRWVPRPLPGQEDVLAKIQREAGAATP